MERVSERPTLDRTANALAALLYSVARDAVKEWRSEQGAAPLAEDDMAVRFASEPRLSRYTTSVRESAVLATETDFEANELTAAVLRLVTRRAERSIELDELRRSQAEIAERRRQELTCERILTKHRGLVALAFEDVRRRLCSEELVDDYAAVFRNPRFVREVGEVPTLSTFWCDHLVGFLEPFARSALGEEYSRQGLRRAFVRYFEEQQEPAVSQH